MRDSENSSPFTAAVQWNAEPEKRNCGRTGPTSAEGRSSSSKNAIKHGACARTLILPGESEEAWELLLNRWLKEYQPAEDSLEYDFVLKTAQAEWQRIRTNRNFNDCLSVITHGLSPYNWSPEQIKKHDLSLRYKTAAERAFQREFRLLEQYYKIHRPVKATPPAPDHEAAQEPAPESSGVTQECANGPKIVNSVPYRPPTGPNLTSTGTPAPVTHDRPEIAKGETT